MPNMPLLFAVKAMPLFLEGDLFFFGQGSPGMGMSRGKIHGICVTDPSVMLAHKVGPGLQDLQKWGQRILVEKKAEEAEKNTWIGQMVVTKSIKELDGLIRSRAA